MPALIANPDCDTDLWVMSLPATASGAREEFEAQLAPVLERAYATARRLTGNAADAEDLVQEAALLAYRGFKTFERGTNFRAWFLRVLMNAFLSSKRRHRAEDGAISLDDLPNAYIQRQAHEVVQSAAPDTSPSDVAKGVLGKLESEQVQAAVDALPEQFRAVAALYFMEDLPYQDIADMLHIPVGTVRSRLHRARALLQKRLWELGVDHGLVSERKA
jgi:RNA polymerase sigma-70 factor (ECF subfamily)